MPRWNEVGKPCKDAITDYMDRAFVGRAANTVTVNEAELNRLLKWGTRHWQTPAFGVDQIGERDVKTYLDPSRPPRRQPTSFNNRRQALVRFFAYCREEGWIDLDPMRRERPYKAVPRKKLWLSAEELINALTGADPRDRMALALGMHTGLRAQDAMSIKVGDLDLRTGSFEVWIQKTSEWSTKPITSELREEVLRWLPEYAKLMGLGSMDELNDNWRLIPRVQPVADGGGTQGFQPGRATRLHLQPDMTVMHPERIVHRALDRLGFTPEQQKGAGFHTLRRGAARNLYDVALEDGTTRDAVGTVQAFLNHNNRETTEIYIGLDLQTQALDDLLRGKSFLGRAADIQEARWEARNGKDDDGPTGLAVAR